MLLAGNRTGKSYSATADLAYHALGDYPDWWEGPVLKGPLTMWCLGVTALQVRDVLQRELFGTLTDNKFDGTGVIPTSRIKQVLRSQSLSGLASDVFVKRSDGTTSRISLKAFSQGSTGQGTLALAGSSVDYVLTDEMPPDDVVAQLRTRTMTGNRGKGGMLLFSMTAELGETELIRQFLEDRQPHQFLRQVSWDECPHLSPEIQKEMIATIPEWQIEMRRTGMPLMGTGLIYPILKDRVECEAFEIPSWYRKIKAIDLGFAHNTGVTWLAYNPESDVLYLVRSYAKNEAIPAVHAVSMNAHWPDVPVVFPHDGDNREKGSGESMIDIYRKAGVDNIISFKNPDGSRYVEPGIINLHDRMMTDRFRVFPRENEPFWLEQRRYHRDDRGGIVKKDDDVMDSLRYGAQMVVLYGITENGYKTKQSYASFGL